MAEKKQHKIVSASSGKEVKKGEAAPEKTEKAVTREYAEASNKPTLLRVLAVVFWVLAIGCEFAAYYIYNGKFEILQIPTTTALILALVLDLALVIVGAQFWKKANHIDPVSEENKVKFWLWNNMGVIVCCFAFLPFVILALINKDADPKLKRIAVIAAAAGLLIGTAASYDYTPVSEEGLAQATQTLSGTTVYWTQYGSKYHTHEDCQHLNRSDVLTAGTIDEAVEAGRSTICKTCASRDGLTVGENGAVTGTVSQTAQEIVEEVVEPAVEEAVQPAA